MLRSSNDRELCYQVDWFESVEGAVVLRHFAYNMSDILIRGSFEAPTLATDAIHLIQF